MKCFTCGFLGSAARTTSRSNQKVSFDVALCGDNELITGIERLSGIANYGVNAAERNRGQESEQKPFPRWDGALVCTSAPDPSARTNTRVCICVFRCTHARAHTHASASITYVYRRLEVKSHYATDALQALGKLFLIGLTETHQRVSTLPHKHTR